jgi:hypothetical protein
MSEPIDKRTVMSHAGIVGLSGELLNIAGAYLGAPEGTEEEQAAEDALTAFLTGVVTLDDDSMSNLLLALASLIVATAPQDDVQAWFDNQAERIAEALDV